MGKTRDRRALLLLIDQMLDRNPPKVKKNGNMCFKI